MALAWCVLSKRYAVGVGRSLCPVTTNEGVTVVCEALLLVRGRGASVDAAAVAWFGCDGAMVGNATLEQCRVRERRLRGARAGEN